jgi:serine/threonine-protein kinase HipA
MTSEAFVYLMLPGQTQFVTAGRIVIDTDRLGVPIGRFVYGRKYLSRSDAVPIDPIELPLTERTYETRGHKGLFASMRDASPDYWGRRVIEKRAGVAQLGEIDYLLHSADDRAGALGFGLNVDPPAPLRTFNRTVHLAKLQALADAIIADEEVHAHAAADAVQTEDLMLLGTSMGGARPKAVVEDANNLWIAKFNRGDDPWNNARVEHAMLTLGRECGIRCAHSRLTTVGARDVLLVQRFDRTHTNTGYQRARMLSALTLLRAGDSHQDRERWSYVMLAEELRRLSAAPQEDAVELFRRMTFNALISNTDDHPRNHACIAPATEWRLSPAYDLTPQPLVSVERRDLALTVGEYGRYANIENMLSQCERFLLQRAEASALITQMQATVRARWYDISRREGVTERDCGKIARAFVYEGLDLPVGQQS